MNNFVETVTMTRSSYDELKNEKVNLITELHNAKQDAQNVKNLYNEALKQIHELKQELVKSNLKSDYNFKEYSLEELQDLEHWKRGIDNLTNVRNYVSDEEILIAIEMKWHEVNDAEED